MRYKKTVKVNNAVTEVYDYVYSDGQLLAITHTASGVSNSARFIYDSTGEIRGFILNDTDTYMYLKNLQGDITALVDESGEIILAYSYDSWGRVTFSATSMANIATALTLSVVNPFTYRGYCYDYDIELYYLQSRYYDPNICRFINADSTDYLGASGGFISYNLFAYCENDAVNCVDAAGTWGADIHYGKKENKSDFANNKGKYEKYDGTFEWLSEFNFKKEYKTIIANACKNVDKNPLTSPINPLGWKYHFTIYSDKDTRLSVAGDELYKAINAFKTASSESKRRNALKTLGKGLHALQDYSAHGSFWPIEAVRTVNSVSYIIVAHSYEYDDPYYNWANNKRNSFSKKLSYLGERYKETYSSTALYISLFLIYIGNYQYNKYIKGT